MRAAVAVAVAVATEVALGSRGASPDTRELAVLGTSAGVAVVDTVSGGVRQFAPVGVASPDGSVLVEAPRSASGLTTTAHAFDVGGKERWSATVAGTFAPRLVSPDGERAVLGPLPTSSRPRCRSWAPSAATAASYRCSRRRWPSSNRAAWRRRSIRRATGVVSCRA
ncbi:MAG: hypothetical protein ACRD0G_20490 [Acidimicrobiales bacterium]